MASAAAVEPIIQDIAGSIQVYPNQLVPGKGYKIFFQHRLAFIHNNLKLHVVLI